ncbi:uncharacterized protein LOC131072399 isoform X3 [Cryptomeria japonica]|uniref:uncharacterized protein LOC131072399 isoform X3 n=1 Tax=Cryptomeria japonica TaxID=3369 RepID=UPI0025ACAF18|nr:uncharacterized protein LOC131072399 isoform X3 [Cryptomeria japonica]
MVTVVVRINCLLSFSISHYVELLFSVFLGPADCLITLSHCLPILHTNFLVYIRLNLSPWKAKSMSQQDQEQQKDPHMCKQEVQLSSQSEQKQEDQPHKIQCEADVIKSSMGVISTANSQNVFCEDIQLVQNLIERCLRLYMNQGEVIKTLLNQAKIEPGFTSLVWEKLEEQNRDFFKAYYTRLKLKKQITLFNHLLERQHQLMRILGITTAPLSSMQNGMHPPSLQHLPIGYPVLQQSLLPVAGHPHIIPIASGACTPVVKGHPAQGNFQSFLKSPTTDNMGESSMEVSCAMHSPCSGVSSMTDIPLSPASAMSSGPFPFKPTDMSSVDMNLMPLDVTFMSGDIGIPNGAGTLQGASEAGGTRLRDSLRVLGHLPWNFSLSDLTADLANGGGSYSGSPFLQPDTEVFLDSPDIDEIDEDFFLDSITEPCSQSDEDKAE